ncbi:hypothetical protein VPHK250G1_0016 [Vibrio phage K250 g1]
MIMMTDYKFIETVKSDIDEVSDKCNEPSLYADILNGVKNKRMFAFAGCGGFFVLMPIYFYGVPYIHVMIACSSKGRVFTDMLGFTKDRAKDIDAKGIFFSTSNERLERASKRFGWGYRGRRGCVTDWVIKL